MRCLVNLCSSALPLLALCAVLVNSGCGAGPGNGKSITGCPDGTVERLALTEGGEVQPQPCDFLESVNRTDHKLVMVDFSTDWCKYCKILKPEIESVKRKWKDEIEVVNVDGDRHSEIAGFLAVSGYPDVRIFRGGIQVSSFVGPMSRADMDSLLKSLQ